MSKFNKSSFNFFSLKKFFLFSIIFVLFLGIHINKASACDYLFEFVALSSSGTYYDTISYGNGGSPNSPCSLISGDVTIFSGCDAKQTGANRVTFICIANQEGKIVNKRGDEITLEPPIQKCTSSNIQSSYTSVNTDLGTTIETGGYGEYGEPLTQHLQTYYYPSNSLAGYTTLSEYAPWKIFKPDTITSLDKWTNTTYPYKIWLCKRTAVGTSTCTDNPTSGGGIRGIVLDEYRDGVKFRRLKEITFPATGVTNIDYDSESFGGWTPGGMFDLSFDTTQLAQNSIIKLEMIGDISLYLVDSRGSSYNQLFLDYGKFSSDINSANSVCVYDPPAPPVLYVR